MIARRYELERPLGHGAMAVVDLALDHELGRRVALKRLAENLARDEEVRARFLREARLAARLTHPNVVRVYDVGEDEGRPFIAMEYVDGETLAEVTARQAPLPPARVVELGVQACAALAAAHDAGLVHRDVKPQNLILRTDGVLKLGDFGVAVAPDGTRLTVAGTVLGTASYLAPEQARGDEATAAADLYGLGAVLYELLAGRPPRTAATLEELMRPAPIAPPPGPPRLTGLVQRCLAADPRDRPRSARELARELKASAEAPAAAAPTLLLRRPQRTRRTFVVAALVAAAAALAAGIATALATRGSSPAPPPAVAPVVPVRHAADTEQQARNLAAWLRRYASGSEAATGAGSAP